MFDETEFAYPIKAPKKPIPRQKVKISRNQFLKSFVQKTE